MKTEIEGGLSLEDLKFLYTQVNLFTEAGYKIEKIFRRSYLSEDGIKYECGIQLESLILSERFIDEN